MIVSFSDDEARRIFEREPGRKYGTFTRFILRKLLQIDAAVSLDELKSPPGNYLEVLRGDRKGQHSIRANLQFRICFEWKGTDAYDVEITDCH